VLVEFGREDPQGAADQPDGTVGMSACPAPVHLAEPAAQQRQLIVPAAGQPLDLAGHGVQAEQTRTALPGG
jgi:hypothetical protein